MKWLASERVHFLPLEKIDPLDLTFSLLPAWSLFSSSRLPDELPEILTPLTGQQAGEAIRIVTGFRRFASAREWGLTSIPLLLADPAYPAPELFKVPILERRSQRDLSLVELATIIRKLILEWELPRAQVISEYLPLLGFPPQPYHFKRLLRLAQLSEPLQRGLDSIDEEILLGMASWPISDQEFLLERMSRLKLGRNKQRQLWQLMNELRDLQEPAASRLDSIWKKAGAFQIEARGELSPADAFQQIWDRLRKLRYPRLTELEDRKTELTRKLEMPRAIQMSFPQFFEGDQIEFRFRARDPEELRQLVRALLKSSGSSEMADLFELL